jgi:glucose-1-phosphate cytidylyltransferase
MQAIILCGGTGTRLREETEFKPKPMVAIGGIPILWHIMRHYRAYGVAEFILCLGYKGEIIRDYFLNYRNHVGDIEIDLMQGTVRHLSEDATDWRIVLADTGAAAMTGARLRRVASYLTGERCFATYGDGVANVDLDALLHRHTAAGRKATVTVVRPPSRFGEIAVDGTSARSFVEKPQVGAGWINGGYFVFETAAIRELPNREDLSLEAHVLEQFAGRGELSVFEHEGFWQCMDTVREMQLLNDLWAAEMAPWKTW